MFCGECGTQNPDTNQFRKNCGKPLKRAQQAQATPPVPAPVPPAAAPQPVYQQPVYQQPVYSPQPAGYPPVSPVPAGAPATGKPPLNKGMLVVGIVGLLLGIISWFRYPYILGFLAIVLGGVAIAKSENKKGAVAIIGIIAVLVGLACIVFDIFYLDILPPTPPDL